MWNNTQNILRVYESMVRLQSINIRDAYCFDSER